MIVVDTNVTSELMRRSPSPALTTWVRARSAPELYTTSITLAEVRYGIERLPDGHRKDLLRTTADEVFSAFADHVLAFDATAAVDYAGIVSSRERAGTPIDGSTHRSRPSAAHAARPSQPATSRTSTAPGSKSPTRGTTAHEARASKTSSAQAECAQLRPEDFVGASEGGIHGRSSPVTRATGPANCSTTAPQV